MSETAKFTPAGSSFIYGVASDRGMVRPIDEDSYWGPPADMDQSVLAEKGWLFIVADGMGGYHGGEVASRIAVETASATYYHYRPAEGTGEFDPVEALRQAVRDAHTGILNAGEQVAENRQMGSTIVMAVIRGADLFVANVGDSRCYRLRAGTLELLTRDHSWVMEQIRAGRLPAQDVRKNPNRSMLIRGLGKTSASAQPDIDHYDWQTGDRLLLCCDGMWDMLDDDHLISFLSMPDPKAATAGMVNAANAGGSQDNVTALIVLDAQALPPPSTASIDLPPTIAREPTSPLDATKPKRVPTLAIGAIIIAIVVLLAAVFVLSQVLSPVQTATQSTATGTNDRDATPVPKPTTTTAASSAMPTAVPAGNATQTISQALAASTPVAAPTTSPIVQETATLSPRNAVGNCITRTVNADDWEWNAQTTFVQPATNGIAVWGAEYIGTRQPITQFFPLPELHAPFTLVVVADIGRNAVRYATGLAVCFHADVNAPQAACANYRTTSDVTNIEPQVWEYRYAYTDQPALPRLRVISGYPSAVVITQIAYCQQ